MGNMTARPHAMGYCFGLLAVLYFVAGSVTLTQGHVWGDDWAQYVLHAENLVMGHPYSPTGYVFNPDFPSVGPPSYPPGLPIILAPAIAIAGVNFIALKAVCFAFLAASLLVVGRVLSDPFGLAVAIIAVILFAAHDQVWALRDSIGSEFPYIFFSMLAIWWAACRKKSSHPLLSGAILGLLIYFATACRSVGAALLPAALIYGWSHRKAVWWFLAFIGMFALLLFLQRVLVVAPPTYSGELRVPTLRLVLGNIVGYWLDLGLLFRLPMGLSPAGGTLVGALAMYGCWTLTKVQNGGGRSIGMREIISRLPFVVLYLLAYLAGLLLTSVPPLSRYLLPILPIVIALALTGVRDLGKRLHIGRRYAIAALAAGAIYYVGLHISAPEPKTDELSTCRSCSEMFAFLRTRTPVDSVIASPKPKAVALFTGRKAWMWSTKYTANQFRDKLKAVGASYIVIAAPNTFLGREYPSPIEVRGIEGQRIFRNDMFTVIDIGRETDPGQVGFKR